MDRWFPVRVCVCDGAGSEPGIFTLQQTPLQYPLQVYTEPPQNDACQTQDVQHAGEKVSLVQRKLFTFFYFFINHIHHFTMFRETSDPSGTAQNEQNNKPWTATLVPRDQISDIIWRGSLCLGVLYLIHAWTAHKCVVKLVV